MLSNDSATWSIVIRQYYIKAVGDIYDAYFFIPSSGVRGNAC